MIKPLADAFGMKKVYVMFKYSITLFSLAVGYNRSFPDKVSEFLLYLEK